MSSTTGKSNMDKKDLSAAEICRIIKVCKNAGVQDFEFSGLKLSFLPRRNEEVVEPGQVTSTVSTEASEKTPQDAPNLSPMDENAFEEAEEAQLMIDDPLAFERMQIQRDIERNRLIDAKA